MCSTDGPAKNYTRLAADLAMAFWAQSCSSGYIYHGIHMPYSVRLHNCLQSLWMHGGTTNSTPPFRCYLAVFHSAKYSSRLLPWQRMHAASSAHHESNEELALRLLPGLFNCCFIAAKKQQLNNLLSSARLTLLFRVATQCSGLDRLISGIS